MPKRKRTVIPVLAGVDLVADLTVPAAAIDAVRSAIETLQEDLKLQKIAALLGDDDDRFAVAKRLLDAPGLVDDIAKVVASRKVLP